MAVPGSVNPMLLGGGAAVYPIDQSLRFNSADSFTFRRTPGSDSTSQKRFTVSVWSKRGVIASGTTSNTGRQSIVYTGLSNGSGNLFGVEWRDDEVACIFNGAGTIYPQTVAKFRDPTAWYHIVVAVDTDQATDTDRCKIYVNGVQQTLTGTLPTSGFAVTNGTTSIHTVGELGTLRSNQYLAEAYYINDQQLEPADFAELNTDGVWVPKKYAGTFAGTNSYYLKFDPSATNGIGHDHSGNGNNFTPTGFDTTNSTASTYDVMSDTPTTNWATLNPLTTSNTTRSPSDGNLVIAFGGTYPTNVLGSFGVSSGKWYWEVGFAGGDSSSGHACGIAVGDWANRNTDPQTVSTPFSHYIDSRANFWNSGSSTANSTNFTVGDIIGVALDADNDEVSFYKNGTIVGSAQSLETGQTWFPLQKNSSFTALTQTVNFGQRDFAYTPPTGFKALNTANLPAPTIKDGGKHFDTVIWTGTGSNITIPLGFNADLVWAKRRQADNHVLNDSVRGEDENLTPNTTASEFTSNYGLNFISTGNSIELEGTGYFGGSGGGSPSFVAWCWDEGAVPGFDIVTYTGDNTTSASRLIDHSLGVTPDFIITKKRSSGTTDYGWSCWHKDLGGNYGILLDAGTNRIPNIWDGYTSFSATKFTPPNLNYGNENAQTYVNYLWAEVEGYSRFGSYIGNGQTGDLAPFVWCGFRPAFVMVRAATTAANWIICDAARNTYNVIEDELVANSNSGENGLAITTAVDFTANGFKIRTNDANWNSINQTLIFAAFAENPFGGSGVSPATAR